MPPIPERDKAVIYITTDRAGIRSVTAVDQRNRPVVIEADSQRAVRVAFPARDDPNTGIDFPIPRILQAGRLSGFCADVNRRENAQEERKCQRSEL